MCWRFLKAPRVPLEDRIFVCPRGVDSEHFSPDRRSAEVRREMREHAGASENSIMLLYAGRISPEKNIGLLIDLMKILAKDETRDFRLVLAGDGPKRRWLKKQAEKHARGKVAFLGHLEKEKLADYYANADVFVHPNPNEPFGIAPLEAMASGVPTIAPNAGGILSYATNDNAWLVESNGEAFAEAVREIVDNEELRSAKVEKALESSRQNTREASTDRLLETYDRIFADFNERNDLYTDVEEPKTFNYWELIKVALIVGCLFILEL
jgi:glycosyltransferase involved in cell wall biosynthesis